MQTNAKLSAGDPVRILHLEDNAFDVELIHRCLRTDGLNLQVEVVATGEDFERALTNGAYDLVISDYSLPGFNGLAALRLVRGRLPHLPFVFVSGTIGEERAIESLNQGASDYVLKDRLTRLPAAVRRALDQAREQEERRTVSEQLRQRNELFRQITGAVDDLILVTSRDGRCVFKSASFDRLESGAAAAGGNRCFQVIHPEDRPRFEEMFRTIVATGCPRRMECRLQLRDGSTRHIESQGSAIHDPEGEVSHVVFVARDVTERELADIRIRQQAALLDQARDAIFVRDLDQRITYWNKGAESIYGWSAAEVIGRRGLEVLRPAGQPPRLDYWQVVLERGEWEGEINQLAKSGQELVVASRRTLLRDAVGQPVAVLTIDTDITETKRLHEQYLRSQRLDNIGALAGGIAHDLNNVLAPILMAAELLRSETSDGPTAQMLGLIKSSAERGAALVKQILQFARGGSGEPVPIALRHLVKDMALLGANTFPRSIQIKTRVESGLYQVLGDSTQLHQVLLNLCVNARDAMPRGGTLSIEASNLTLDSRLVPGKSEPCSGPHVLLSVADTGVGIPPELLGKIFEPFFTTKPEGQGTGLGLATVADIVRNHQGFVEVESVRDAGTSFKVYLPAILKVERPPAPAQPEGMPLGNGEWVLLVDDEFALLELTREMLEAYQYHVVSARDGAEALRLFREVQDRFQVVVTDLMMPVMSGAALIRTLRATAPDLRIICISGLGLEKEQAEIDPAQVDAFVRKPYAARDILETLRALLQPQ